MATSLVNHARCACLRPITAFAGMHTHCAYTVMQLTRFTIVLA